MNHRRNWTLEGATREVYRRKETLLRPKKGYYILIRKTTEESSAGNKNLITNLL